MGKIKLGADRAVRAAGAAAVCASFALATTGCAAGAAEAAGRYVPGTYTGEGNGMSGPIEVTLTVDAEAITSVDGISDSGETKGVGGKEAIEDGTFAAQIVEAQSSEIDGVSGATVTTGGVKQAVDNALAQAANE
ncbi:FMN-binding protein [Eggerthella guodeyinii]|uniref:FMN-binding protein n=1 Tax=Eggerthella guodeyinii TaxID=2690837 RepID=A0A6N7RP37_9ACTN|nr:FMN-binding protein [Eggerthella guodeyinii]MRX83115.1 FMN-binding protein [Eggerthella guodeyinii]